MTDQKPEFPAGLAMRNIGAILLGLESNEERLGVLCGAVRATVKVAAKDAGCPTEDLLEFFIRRLRPDAARVNLRTATDQLVHDIGDCHAVCVVLMGGKHEGACSSFTAKGDDLETRTLLVRALRGLANGIERRQEDTGQISFSGRVEKPS